jgi:chromosome segregation ATPase
MTLSARHGSHGPSELVRLQAEIERLQKARHPSHPDLYAEICSLRDEIERLRAVNSELEALSKAQGREIVLTRERDEQLENDMEKLRAANAELLAALIAADAALARVEQT